MTTVRRIDHLRRVVGQDRRWVAIQFALLGAAAIGGILDSRRRRGLMESSGLTTVAGLTLLVAGMTTGARAKRDLAESFTISPSPADGGFLVDHGIYAVIRHPMYLSVLLLVSGYALALRSRLAGIGTLAAVGFFTLKIRHEERELRRRYPEYAGYADRVVWRVVPGLV